MKCSAKQSMAADGWREAQRTGVADAAPATKSGRIHCGRSDFDSPANNEPLGGPMTAPAAAASSPVRVTSRSETILGSNEELLSGDPYEGNLTCEMKVVCVAVPVARFLAVRHSAPYNVYAEYEAMRQLDLARAVASCGEIQGSTSAKGSCPLR
jgi:hypothetical protein